MPSFQAVYAEYLGFVRASGRRLGADPNALDDVVQDVFMVIHRRLHTLQHPQAIRSWIYCVVRRTVNNHRRSMRSRRVEPIGVESSELTSPALTPFQALQLNAELELVVAALAKLDQPKRAVFELVRFEEMTVPQAAASLRIPRNTAYTRLRAARREFDAAFARVPRTTATLNRYGVGTSGGIR
jgi:RNA polymerase sigma-70 factor (ECF subfamily)